MNTAVFKEGLTLGYCGGLRQLADVHPHPRVVEKPPQLLNPMELCWLGFFQNLAHSIRLTSFNCWFGTNCKNNCKKPLGITEWKSSTHALKTPLAFPSPNSEQRAPPSFCVSQHRPWRGSAEASPSRVYASVPLLLWQSQELPIYFLLMPQFPSPTYNLSEQSTVAHQAEKQFFRIIIAFGAVCVFRVF